VHFLLFFNRSVFEVRFRHPEGRLAGEAYLKQLTAMSNPWLKEKPEHPVNSPFQNMGERWVNPETPQFPPGSMWALVRRALLADSNGNPVASPVVESVQVRVYRTLDEQTPFEWETRHGLLLGKGGFHLTEPADQPAGLFIAAFRGGGETFLKNDRSTTQLLCMTCPHLRAVTRARVEEVAVTQAGAAANWKALREKWDGAPGAGKGPP
jgi:hypothetical protein